VCAVDEAVLGAPALQSDRLAAAAPAGLGHVVVTLGATGAGERDERLRAVAGLAYKDVPVPHRRRTPGAVGPAHDDPPLCLYLRITNRISVLLALCSNQPAAAPRRAAGGAGAPSARTCRRESRPLRRPGGACARPGTRRPRRAHGGRAVRP